MKKVFVIAILFFTYVNAAVSNDITKAEFQRVLDSVEVIIKNNPNLTPTQIESLKSSAIYNLMADTNFRNLISKIYDSDPQFDLLSKKENVSEIVVKVVECDTGNTDLRVHWHSGLPRTGIFTDCSGNTININYFDSSINPPLNCLYITSPDIELNEIKFAPSHNIVKIIDALTGMLVIDKTFPSIIPDSIDTLDLGASNPPAGVPPLTRPNFDINRYNPVDISTLAKGIYFISIFNNLGEVIYIKTLDRN